MSEFEFRLQRILDYRQLVEGWAKDAFLEARLARLEGEAMLDRLAEKRAELLHKPAESLPDRQAMQACLEKLEEDERQQRIVNEMLEADEEKRRDAWVEARREVQTLEKLRDRAFAVWLKEENRREQRELDEWALQRRPA